MSNTPRTEALLNDPRWDSTEWESAEADLRNLARQLEGRLTEIARELNGVANAMAATVCPQPEQMQSWRRAIEKAYDQARG